MGETAVNIRYKMSTAQEGYWQEASSLLRASSDSLLSFRFYRLTATPVAGRIRVGIGRISRPPLVTKALRGIETPDGRTDTNTDVH